MLLYPSGPLSSALGILLEEGACLTFSHTECGSTEH